MYLCSANISQIWDLEWDSYISLGKSKQRLTKAVVAVKTTFPRFIKGHGWTLFAIHKKRWGKIEGGRHCKARMGCIYKLRIEVFNLRIVTQIIHINKKIFLTLISMERMCPFQGDLIYPGRIGGHEVKCCCQDSSTSSIGRLLNSGCERLRISQFHKKGKEIYQK